LGFNTSSILEGLFESALGVSAQKYLYGECQCPKGEIINDT